MVGNGVGSAPGESDSVSRSRGLECMYLYSVERKEWERDSRNGRARN